MLPNIFKGPKILKSHGRRDLDFTDDVPAIHTICKWCNVNGT
jgi:hypothetical protein